MPDVDIRRGKEPQRFGLTASAIPEANGSQTGVSVENAQSETKQWYVLRVSYCRAEKANEILSWENKSVTYDEKREAVENLLHEFCKANGGY